MESMELFWIWVWVLSGDLYTRGDLGRWVWLFSSTKSDMGFAFLVGVL